MNDFIYILGFCLFVPVGLCLAFLWLGRVPAWEVVSKRYGTTALGPPNLKLGRASVGWWRGLVYAGSTPTGLFLEYPSATIPAAFIPWSDLSRRADGRVGPFVRLSLVGAEFSIFVHPDLLPSPWPSKAPPPAASPG